MRTQFDRDLLEFLLEKLKQAQAPLSVRTLAHDATAWANELQQTGRTDVRLTARDSRRYPNAERYISPTRVTQLLDPSNYVIEVTREMVPKTKIRHYVTASNYVRWDRERRRERSSTERVEVIHDGHGSRVLLDGYLIIAEFHPSELPEDLRRSSAEAHASVVSSELARLAAKR